LVDVNPTNSVAAALDLDAAAAKGNDGVWWTNVRPGLDVVSSASNALIRLVNGLKQQASHYRNVIIDVPAAVPNELLSVLSICDTIVLVGAESSNDLSSIQHIAPSALILKLNVQTRRTNQKATIGTTQVTTVPYEPRAGQALLVGRSLTELLPGSPAAQSFRALASQLGLLIDQPPRPPQKVTLASELQNPLLKVIPAESELSGTGEPLNLDQELLPEWEAPPPLPQVIPPNSHCHLDQTPVTESSSEPLNLDQELLPEWESIPPLPEPIASDAHVQVECAPISELPASVDLDGNVASSPAAASLPPVDGFQVEYDMMTHGGSWIGNMAKTPEIGRGIRAFTAASTQRIDGPPVSPPIERPISYNSSNKIKAPLKDKSSHVSHGVELGAPTAALIKPGRRADADEIWGPKKQLDCVDSTTHDFANPTSIPTPLPTRVPACRAGGEFHSLAVSGESAIIAGGCGDGSILLWSLTDGQCIGELKGHRGPVRNLSFAIGGRVLASGGADKSVRLWDCSTERERQIWNDHDAAIVGVEFSPDGRVLATADNTGFVRVWDIAAGCELRTIRTGIKNLHCLAFSPDGEMLATAGADGRARFWKVVDGSLIADLCGRTAAIHAIAYTPDGRTLASGDENGLVTFWDVATRQEWNNLESQSGTLTGIAFSPDGQTIATSGHDGRVKLWDSITGHCTHELQSHQGQAVGVVFSPDGQTVISAGTDQIIRAWYVENGQLRGTICKSKDSMTGDGLGFDIDISAGPIELRSGRTLRQPLVLAASSSDGRIRLWDVANPASVRGEPARIFVGHALDVNAIAFSPDGSRLASASGDKVAIVWETSSGQPLTKLAGHDAEVAAVAFSPDGERIATGGWDTRIKFWNATTGTEKRNLNGAKGAVTIVAFHPKAPQLASAGWDKAVLLWDVAAANVSRQLNGHDKMVTALAFSPNGAFLATGSWDKTARLWDHELGQCRHIFRGHKFAVSAVAFSPDGSMLATGSWDTTIKLWDLGTKKEMRTLIGHMESVRSVAFAPDGSMLTTGSWDGTIRLWDPQTGNELACLQIPNTKFHAVTFAELGMQLL